MVVLGLIVNSLFLIGDTSSKKLFLVIVMPVFRGVL